MGSSESESQSGKNDDTSAAVFVGAITNGDAQSLKEWPQRRVGTRRGVSVREGELESVWCTGGGRQGVRDDAAKSYRSAGNFSDLKLGIVSRNGGLRDRAGEGDSHRRRDSRARIPLTVLDRQPSSTNSSSFRRRSAISSAREDSSRFSTTAALASVLPLSAFSRTNWT